MNISTERRWCCCTAWAANIDKINGPVLMQALRSGFMRGYDGAVFVFCPWCGTRLPELKLAKQSEDR